MGYDYIPVSDESFSVIYFTFSGKMIEGADSAQKISMTLIYMQLMKGILFFCLYSVINSSFCFLHYAGSSVEGFYQHRTWLALLIAVIIIAFNYWLMVYVSQRQFDITER